jgi:hypothetical protein
MGKWVYRKEEPSHIRGVCVHCKKRPQRSKNGGKRYAALCGTCEKKLFDPNHKARVERKHRPYREFVKTHCEKCGFSSEYPCQFDVDHIDGNHSNNDPDNLQTLCSNCHRLKTYLNKDWKK